MWNTILGVHSFITWPLTLVFLIYATGRILLFWEWKIFVVGFLLFTLSTGIEIALGIIAD